MIDLTLKVKTVLQAQCVQRRFVIAYSGGVDSHVLLYIMTLLREQQPDLELLAVHVNHHLQAESLMWEQHCQHVCEDLEVPYVSVTINPQDFRKGHSVEAEARRFRYAALEKFIDANTILLTAHHQDDQAETLLLHLFRGAGLTGLAAMPVKLTFKETYQLRPLLQSKRSEIIAYANQHQLQWIEDPSNLDINYRRNFIRQQVMPLLQQHWPSVVDKLAASADYFAETSHLLEAYVVQDYQAIQCVGFLNAICLSVSGLLEFAKARQQLIIRFWLKQQNIPMPSYQQCEHIIQDCLYADHDANPCVMFSDQWECRRYQDKLYVLMRCDDGNSGHVLSWDFAAPLVLPNQLGKLTAELVSQTGLRTDLNTQFITVRFRQGGESIKIVGHAHHKLLKKCFQEWQVPTWLRGHIPLLYYKDELIAVVGYVIAEGFQSVSDKAWIIQHQSVLYSKMSPG